MSTRRYGNKAVIASGAKQSRGRLHCPTISGSPRRFAPRDDDSVETLPELALRGPFVEHRRSALVPDGIGREDVAGRVELSHLFGRQLPTHGPDVLDQLLLVARADDDAGDRRAAKEPIERDLRNGLAGFGGDAVERVDDGE
jgi:hypothetical protein